MGDKIKENILLIHKLVKNDLKARYSGSVFGMVWAFVQPLVTILVFWYVFQIGFKNPPVNDVEFILWLVAGYIPWTFFNDGVMSSTNVLYEYSYLVKKIKFKEWMLPIIKVFSALYIHSFFMIFIVGIYLIYGHSPQVSWLSILYYSFALTVLLFGVSFIVSSLAVFLKDASQFIAIALQIGFWLAPVFWDVSTMTESVMKILRCNPMYYILTGYRNAMISGINFWEEPIGTIAYYWCFTAVVLFLGVKTFKKLRVHFADLL